MNKKEEQILKEAKDRLNKAVDEDRENRRLAKSDLEFVAIEGAQWPSDIKIMRGGEDRPCLTINKMPIFIDQVVGDQRMNRPSINVVPVDSKADKKVAYILSGWIRHVQKISKSDVAVDHAFEHAVASGYGALRVVTKYSSDSSFEQDAYIEKIDNALAVYFGKHSEYDASDAMYCFIISDLDRDEFKEKYGKEPKPFSTVSDEFITGWATQNTVRVAEYFVKEPIVKTIYLLEDGRVVDKLSEGEKPVRERKVNSYKIMWYLLSSDEILDKREWLGKKYIPVVPIWGKEFNVAGKRVIRSLIRNAKDSQRQYNYWQALSLNTLIPVPCGWLKLENVHAGHQVFDEKGRICNVVDTSPIFTERNCLEVTFDDGSTVVADAKHLWTVEERGARKSATFDWQTKTITTDQLVPGKHFIAVAEPLELAEKQLPIHPYVLGVWLGDGSSREPNITQLPDDWEVMAAHLKFFGCKLGPVKNSNGCVNVTLLGLRDKFTQLNLLGNKHIPFDYVRGSKEQRLYLLQGLMDTDGSVSAVNGACSFTTTSYELAKGFAELTRSLGIKAKCLIRNRNGSNVYDNAKTQYQFYFTTRLPVFRLLRKLKGIKYEEAASRRINRYSIKSIIPVESVPVKCLTVDSPSSLYLAGTGMIPTHNSVDTETVALQPKSPYILTPTQVKGHEEQWKEAHRKNYPYLLANADKDAPGWPHREPPPQVSSAMVEKLRETDQEMRDTVGLQKAALGMQSNERSGAAIRERKKEGDTGTFAFIDNLSRSLEHVGRILVDIAPSLLDTERVVRLGLEDGGFEFESVNLPAPDGKLLNDLSIGTYDVVVTVGPSFSTQRTEARQSMQEFIQYYPQAAAVIGDLYAKSMDWPGADQLAERLTFLLPPEVKAEMEKKKAAKEGLEVGNEPPQPTPEETAQINEAQLKLQEMQIKIEQEQTKLEGLKIKNEILLNSSRGNFKKLLEEVLAEDESSGEKEAEDASEVGSTT
jgi:hypothetical protein